MDTGGARLDTAPLDTALPIDSSVAFDTALPKDTAAPIDIPVPIDTAISRDTVAIDGPSNVDTARPDVSVLDVSIAELGVRDAPLPDAALSEAGAPDGGEAATFAASLNGAQEVPPVLSTAIGVATFALSADRTQLTYHVTHNVAGGTASHLHFAAFGESGAVIYPLTPFSSDMSGVLTIALADADRLDQGLFYVNVHSATYPGGEIRGQILHPGDTLWTANLTGAQETPPVVSTGTGHASVILDAAKSTLRYHVSTTGLTLTNSHIHKAIAAIAGGVIYPLTPLGAIIDGMVAVTATDAQDLADGHWYVNVHTAANPGGELRGQVLLPGEALYSAALSGANEVPPVSTTATGGAQFILDPAGTTLRYEAVFTGLTATASHIHSGAVGINGPVLYPLTLTAGGAKGTQAVTAGDVINLNAGDFYINAHTAANPGGEIRGQITRQ
jgi:hypothetical protein